MAVVKLRQEFIDLLISIEDDEKSSQPCARIQEIND